MKIFFCDNSLKSLVGFRGEVIKHFLSQGHDITLVAPIINDEDNSAIVPDGCKLHQLHMEPSSINPLKDLFLFGLYLKFFLKERPQIVFNYTIKPNIYACLAAKMCGAYVVDTLTGLGYTFNGNGMAKSLGRMMYRIGLHFADKVFMLNEANRQVILDSGFVDEKKIVLLEGGEGVDLIRFAMKEETFDTSIRFLMIARVLYDKGYLEFVEAARIIKQKYKNVEFEILGSVNPASPMGVQLDTLVNDVASGRIKYLGYTNDVPYYIARDGVVVVLPSYHEGMNCSLMEGCAMGRPIIATNIPGCREMVDDGENGFLCNPMDSESLASAMKKFLDLPETRKREMSGKSRIKAEERFDVRKVFKYYEREIESALTCH